MATQFFRGLYLPGNGIGPLHILSYKKNGGWTCRCLEYDIGAESSSSKTAAIVDIKKQISQLLDAAGDLSRKIPPASPEAWRAWNSMHGNVDSSRSSSGHALGVQKSNRTGSRLAMCIGSRAIDLESDMTISAHPKGSKKHP